MPAPDRSISMAGAIGRYILMAATSLCLASIGGAMAVAAPILLPLLWVAARHSSRWGRGLWIVLAALSAGEASWIYGYWIGGDSSILLLWMPITAAVVIVILFTGTLDSADHVKSLRSFSEMDESRS